MISLVIAASGASHGEGSLVAPFGGWKALSASPRAWRGPFNDLDSQRIVVAA